VIEAMAGTPRNPPNRFRTVEIVHDEPGLEPRVRLEVATDASRSIVSRNDSPDLGFDYTVNPYRGCSHACSYCYARPTHEYLDLGAGTDFERRLLAKPDAPRLLRAAFDRPSWRGDLVLFSGVTDCYQPLEARMGLTRGCLEVCRDYANPVGIVTKSPLITRDVDLLRELHAVTSLTISVSIPVGDAARARAVEPTVPAPARRLQAIEMLAEAGLDVGINVAPFIPGLTEHDLEGLLKGASDAGATRAWTTMLRLPGAVRPVFEAAIAERLPLTASKILGRIRDVRGGRLNDTRFGARMRGEGPYAESVARLFERLRRRYGLDGSRSRARPLEPSTFARPRRRADDAQLSLL
jgi:DNA repair photolyase